MLNENGADQMAAALASSAHDIEQLLAMLMKPVKANPDYGSLVTTTVPPSTVHRSLPHRWYTHAGMPPSSADVDTSISKSIITDLDTKQMTKTSNHRRATINSTTIGNGYSKRAKLSTGKKIVNSLPTVSTIITNPTFRNIAAIPENTAATLNTHTAPIASQWKRRDEDEERLIEGGISCNTLLTSNLLRKSSLPLPPVSALFDDTNTNTNKPNGQPVLSDTSQPIPSIVSPPILNGDSLAHHLPTGPARRESFTDVDIYRFTQPSHSSLMDMEAANHQRSSIITTAHLASATASNTTAMATVSSSTMTMTAASTPLTAKSHVDL
ncbi:hypothetical protein BDF19DRAFT_455313 [Syncephalis fuscata]|nr:hypothetical protein BDF19DRAFT_455313 [Syncephalis fuscata]